MCSSVFLLLSCRQARRATRSTSSESRAVIQSVFFLVFFWCSRAGEAASHFSARRFWCPYFYAVVQSSPPGHSIHVLEISRCNAECVFSRSRFVALVQARRDTHFAARRFWCSYFHTVVQSGPPGHSVHVLEISRCNAECFFPGVFWCSRAGEAR